MLNIQIYGADSSDISVRKDFVSNQYYFSNTLRKRVHSRPLFEKAKLFESKEYLTLDRLLLSKEKTKNIFRNNKKKVSTTSRMAVRFI